MSTAFGPIQAPQGAIQGVVPRDTSELAGVETAALVSELVRRAPELEDRASIRSLHELAELLVGAQEDVANRYSLGYVRVLLERYFWSLPPGVLPDPRGLDVVEVGAGNESPLALGVALLAHGASTVRVIDGAALLDPGRAARAAGKVAAAAVLRPEAVFGPRYSADSAAIVENLRDVDVEKLLNGSLDGLPGRIDFRAQFVGATDLEDASAHLVLSNAFLEHVSLDEALRDMHRFSRVGALHIHNLDFNDHGIYDGTAASPISFLTERPGDSFVRTCNRVRHSQLVAAFERHGFELLHSEVYERHAVSAQEREQLCAEWADASEEDLAICRCQYVFRKLPPESAPRGRERR